MSRDEVLNALLLTALLSLLCRLRRQDATRLKPQRCEFRAAPAEWAFFRF